MRKLFFILFLVLTTTKYAAAQEQYVELVLTDTLLVEPQQWNFFVTLEKTYDAAIDSVSTEDVPPAKTTQKKTTEPKPADDPLAALRALALANGGEIIKDTNFVAYATYPSLGSWPGATEEPGYLNIKFNSRTGLQGFAKAISQQPNVRGYLTGTFHPQLALFNDALDAKIMDKARAKAEHMARLSGRRLGKVLLISEVTSSDGNALKDFLNKLLELGKSYGGSGWKEGLQNLLAPDKIKLEHALRIRFALQ